VVGLLSCLRYPDDVAISALEITRHYVIDEVREDRWLPVVSQVDCLQARHALEVRFEVFC